MDSLSIHCITFNAGRRIPLPAELAAYLFSYKTPFQSSEHNPQPDLIALCVQEIAPIGHAFLGGAYLVPYLRAYRDAVSLAAKDSDAETGYVNLLVRNVGMVVIMIFVRRIISPRIVWAQVAGVGAGLWQMGNKGAVGVRLGYKGTDDQVRKLAFVSAHLAPMEDACERRNQDWKTIVQGLMFEPVRQSPLSRGPSHRLYHALEDTTTPLDDPSEDQALLPKGQAPSLYTSDTCIILAGDLNYRTSSHKPDAVDQAHFPQPSEDDSYPLHFEHLLSSDQLLHERRANRTCHGFLEAPIDFPPTYKYSDQAQQDISTGTMDPANMDDEGAVWKWALHRFPSWCDRILFSNATAAALSLRVEGYMALPLLSTSDHRPVGCRFSLTPEHEAKVSAVSPFSPNLQWRAHRQWARALELLVGSAAFLTTMWNPVWQIPIIGAMVWILAIGIN